MLVTYTALEQDYLNKITSEPVSFDVSTSFGDVSGFLFTTFFAVIVAAAFVRYVMAGVYRIQASEAGIRKSNETIKRVTLGLLGVFGLFLVLYTVNRGFLESDINLDGLRITGGSAGVGGTGVVTSNPGTGNQTGTGQQAGTGTGGGSLTEEQYQEKVKKHNAVAEILRANNITTNHNYAPCTKVQLERKQGQRPPPSCTSLVDLPQGTINLLINLKKACNCDVVVTGGTEGGHTTHGEGLGPVDLRITTSNDPLYSFIKTNGTKLSDAGNYCTPRYEWGGRQFCDENLGRDRHWHIR
jgi:hypothetical protein